MAKYRANSEKVVEAWLSSLPGLSSSIVAAQVPEKAEQNSSLIQSGFMTYRVVGGNPNEYVPERQPVYEIRTYGFAAQTASRRPPWNISNDLAEIVVNAVYDQTSFNAVLSLGADYPTAQVQQGKIVTEPQRSYGDKAYWGVYRTEIQLFWRELPS